MAALGPAVLGLRREYYLIVDGALLILIFVISGALQSPTTNAARVVVNGQEQLRIGDRLRVKPGELISNDAVIVILPSNSIAQQK